MRFCPVRRSVKTVLWLFAYALVLASCPCLPPSFSADSSRELAVWLGCLMQVIRSALSCSEVALRLWTSPWNKVCADCGAASPEWASVNLLVVICEACAGELAGHASASVLEAVNVV